MFSSAINRNKFGAICKSPKAVGAPLTDDEMRIKLIPLGFLRATPVAQGCILTSLGCFDFRDAFMKYTRRKSDVFQLQIILYRQYPGLQCVSDLALGNET